MLANWRVSKQGQARLTSARFDAEVRLIETESEAKSLTIIADAQAMARQSIETTIDSGRGMVEITRDDITQSIEFQGRKRIANSRSVIEDAANDLSDKEVVDHEPDPDWTARFFDCVQDVSSEDMQKIWAKILSGEVESPGRTSLRTLDTLRNMTKKDAETFGNLCDFVIRGDFVFYEDSVKDVESLRYANLLHLQDCGLVNVVPNLTINLDWKDNGYIALLYQSDALMITRDQESTGNLQIPIILLTTAGKELYMIAQFTLKIGYLRAFSKFLKTKSCQLFYLDDVVSFPDGTLRFDRRTLIEPYSKKVHE